MITLIAFLSVLAMQQPIPVPANIVWVTSGEFCEPETVLPLPDDTLLISNVCGFKKPGSGFLTLLNSDGNVIDWRIVDGLDAPLGMALQEDRLFIIDMNRVKIFSWPEYKLLEVIDLNTEVANDITVANDDTIYVSDTAGHKVVQIEKDGAQSVFTGKSQFQGANGIHIDGKTLFIGGIRLWQVDLVDQSVTAIGPDWLTDIDGIEMEPDGTLQITPVAGPLIRFCNSGESEILEGDGISSANHGYAAKLGLALIPTGFDNTVVAIRIIENDGDTVSCQSRGS
jgi:hypothetical protein